MWFPVRVRVRVRVRSEVKGIYAREKCSYLHISFSHPENVP